MTNESQVSRIAVSIPLQHPRALYVHVPFCLHHCGYCDFTLVANRDQLIPEYLAALSAELDHELSAVTEPLEVDTIFIGGGTPTHLSPTDLSTLFRVIGTHFHLAAGGEFTVEANPDGLCIDRLKVLSDNGINRLSLGVQSFNDSVLRTLERRHSEQNARNAVHQAIEWIPNVSIDLIFGVPGQSLESWRDSLRTAISLPVSHISTYGLAYESGTPFFRKERSGNLRRIPDAVERQMYLDAIDTLTSSHFEHYEVSSFAKSGRQCRHNRVYWNADEYFAFGPGAARYVNGIRSTNCRSVNRWLNSWKRSAPCLQESEQLTPEERAREAIMLALRMIEGLNIPSFESRFGFSLEQLAPGVTERHRVSRLLEFHEDHLRLTRDGLLIADSVVADFL